MILSNRPPSAKQNKPTFVKFLPNKAGQGGSKNLYLQAANGRLITIRFETAEEVKELLSQAHIIHHNFNDPELS